MSADLKVPVILIHSCRCANDEKVKVVHVVARNIDKLSTQLVECADAMAEAMEEEDGEADQVVQEDTELLRRDWSSQVSYGSHYSCDHEMNSLSGVTNCRCIFLLHTLMI